MLHSNKHHLPHIAPPPLRLHCLKTVGRVEANAAYETSPPYL